MQFILSGGARVPCIERVPYRADWRLSFSSSLVPDGQHAFFVDVECARLGDKFRSYAVLR